MEQKRSIPVVKRLIANCLALMDYLYSKKNLTKFNFGSFSESPFLKIKVIYSDTLRRFSMFRLSVWIESKFVAFPTQCRKRVSIIPSRTRFFSVKNSQKWNISYFLYFLKIYIRMNLTKSRLTRKIWST